ncbi:MAG: histidine phosphatase family protein, partial [Mycobacterium sp.]|nr:histidine phosphatase family protein [Mycobacterium sp.]
MHNRTRTVIWKAAVALAAVITVGACSGPPPVRSITLTFIRHAESESNAQNMTNTDIPGPSITEEGQGQAEQLAHQLSRNNFDGVYASNMIRTQQTAAPLAHALGKHIQVLPGLREVDAGWYNHTPTRPACVHDDQQGGTHHDKWLDAKCSPYLLAPADWLNGDLQDAIPGSISGKKFNDEFTDAVQRIYDSRNTRPVAFSHAVAIMYWTLMNVKNP